MAKEAMLKDFTNISGTIIRFNGTKIMSGEIIKAYEEDVKVLVEKKLVKELNTHSFSK